MGLALFGAGFGAGVFLRRRTPAQSGEPTIPPETASKLERLAELERTTSSLRHDIRGILSPALLVADRLLGSEDPQTRRAGEVISRTVDRAAARLAETKEGGKDERAA